MAKMITLPLLLAFHKGDQQDGDPHDDISGAGRSFISVLSRNASHKHKHMTHGSLISKNTHTHIVQYSY